MRVLYALLIALCTPLIMLYLGWRGLRDNRYWHGWGERFGYLKPGKYRHGVLLHAASLGELNAAGPLLKALQSSFPDLPVAVSTLTPTGAEGVLQNLGEHVFHTYLPLDLRGAVERFLDRLQPCLIIIVETEIWPNLYLQAHKRGTPLVMANARLSAVSRRRFRYVSGFIRRVLQTVAWVGAQSTQDAQWLIACGTKPRHTQVTGNLKFDLSVLIKSAGQADATRAIWGSKRPVLVAGSTHERDEHIVIPAFIEILKKRPDALLVLAPRRPERFCPVAAAVRLTGLRMALHSEFDHSLLQTTQCLVVDAMGVLLMYYACADLVFIGGSFGTQGGHNALEPAALGKPVLMGPNMQNATEIAGQLVNCGAALQVTDQQAFQSAANRVLGDDSLREQMGLAGQRLVEENKGALNKTLQAIQRILG